MLHSSLYVGHFKGALNFGEAQAYVTGTVNQELLLRNEYRCRVAGRPYGRPAL
jgi:hypothetical protein